MSNLKRILCAVNGYNGTTSIFRTLPAATVQVIFPFTFFVPHHNRHSRLTRSAKFLIGGLP